MTTSADLATIKSYILALKSMGCGLGNGPIARSIGISSTTLESFLKGGAVSDLTESKMCIWYVSRPK